MRRFFIVLLFFYLATVYDYDDEDIMHDDIMHDDIIQYDMMIVQGHTYYFASP